MTNSSNVLWTMLIDAPRALPLIHKAAADAGFRATITSAQEPVVDVPRSVIQRRRHARLMGSTSSLGTRTVVTWTSDSPYQELYAHLLAIEENLPQGAMYFHGLQDAASRAGLEVDAKTRRDIVRHLHRNELVRAAGQGQLNGSPGFVVLTDRRLLFVADQAASAELAMDMRDGTIDRLTLGKRISGETLTITSGENTAEISKLGHGEGYGIAASFRSAARERARTSPPHDSTSLRGADHDVPTG